MSEQVRLNTLHDYNILDSIPEKDFDDIVELASIICDTPISLISLIDSDRQWFKAREGLNTNQTDRKYAFCHYAIENPTETMVVSDSMLDDRFKTNPLVLGDPNIRFYAGTPLVTKDGHALGTLCVIDVKPRSLSDKEERALKKLASRVMNLLELRKENINQKMQLSGKDAALNLMLERYTQAQHTALIGSWDWDVLTNELYWSPEMYNIFEMNEFSKDDLLFKWQSNVHPEDLAAVKKTLEDGINVNKSNSIQYRIIGKNKEIKWVETTGTVKTDDRGKTVRMQGTVQNITARKEAEERQLKYTKTLEEIMFDFSHKVRQPLANCIGVIHAINSENLSIKKAQEFVNYFKESALSFDGMIREISAFVHKSKTEIS